VKKKKYLSLYYLWMEKEMLPKREGLCTEFGDYDALNNKWYFRRNPLFLLMMPEAYEHGRTGFWAGSNQDDWWKFNDLRQNIVLLMAAMNNEL
jgi:hypothetical protein